MLHALSQSPEAVRESAGRDPKPWPPPFKLNREMVDAMGGADSEPYRRFRAYACEAYNILRKRAPPGASHTMLASLARFSACACEAYNMLRKRAPSEAWLLGHCK